MRTMKTVILSGFALAVAGCNPATKPAKPPAETPGPTVTGPVPAPPAPPASNVFVPVEPRAPGTPGGLPDDRTPVSEAPFTPESAQGAADVVQTYFALIGEAKYAQAWLLWGDGGKGSGQSQAAFVAGFAPYVQYDAQVGAPGRIEGAAGSLHIEVPVQIYGYMKTGEAFHRAGPVRLRRVNDVDGSTPEQRLWRIEGMDLKAY